MPNRHGSGQIGMARVYVTSMPPDWYVALVPSGREAVAEAHLLAAGFCETFCPRYVFRTVVRGRMVEDMRAVFSGYVLAACDTFTPDLWHLACPPAGRPCLGCGDVAQGTVAYHHGLVRGFIGGWPPDPIAAMSVERQRACCDAAGLWIAPPEPELVRHVPGTLVRVIDSIYTDHIFSVVWDDGRGLNIRPLQGSSFPLYIARERVQLVSQVEPAPRPPLNVRAPRSRNRMKFRAIPRCA